MKVIIGNHHLKELGGSEQFTYYLAKAYKKLGYEVYVILGNALETGLMSNKIEKDLDIKIDYCPENCKYDLALLSHATTVNRFLNEYKPKIIIKENNIFQVLHGVFHQVEMPVLTNIKYLAVSYEVANNALAKGVSKSDLNLINNPVDVGYFSTQKKVSKKLKSVYSLSQSDEFNRILKRICEANNYNFDSNNKHSNAIVNVRDSIEKADLVVSLGRGCYEAMSMGRNVLVADKRQYMNYGYMDGLLNGENFNNFSLNNCSGRYNKIKVSAKLVEQELKKYNPFIGEKLREIAVQKMCSLKVAKDIINMTVS